MVLSGSMALATADVVWVLWGWRRAMGVEPTEQRLSTRPTGFEDRGQHQPNNARHG